MAISWLYIRLTRYALSAYSVLMTRYYNEVIGIYRWYSVGNWVRGRDIILVGFGDRGI